MRKRNVNLVSPEEAGRVIGVSGRSIRNWIRGGKLDGSWLKTPSGQYRVSLPDLQQICRGNQYLGFRPAPDQMERYRFDDC